MSRQKLLKGSIEMARKVRIRNLEEGDFVIAFNASVENIYTDPDGLWIDWSDGNCGYVLNPNRVVEVME